MSSDTLALVGIVASALAVLIAPAIAVYIGRKFEREKIVRDRQMEVFRRLAMTRSMPMHADHVWALNLVQIEFSDNTQIMAAWRTYLQSLNRGLPPNASAQDIDAFSRERKNLLTALISVIGQHLRLPLRELDIHEYGYTPQGWDTEIFEQTQLRRHLLDLLRGLRALPIVPFNPAQSHGVYPPPPAVGTSPTPTAPPPAQPSGPPAVQY